MKNPLLLMRTTLKFTLLGLGLGLGFTVWKWDWGLTIKEALTVDTIDGGGTGTGGGGGGWELNKRLIWARMKSILLERSNPKLDCNWRITWLSEVKELGFVCQIKDCKASAICWSDTIFKLGVWERERQTKKEICFKFLNFFLCLTEKNG